MGAAQSRKEGSSVYNEDSWSHGNLASPIHKRIFKMSDHTDRTPRDISGPLGPVDLYTGEYLDSNNLYQQDEAAASATATIASEKTKATRLKTKVFGAVGRAGTAGLGKAVDALDTIGSSMTNFNVGSGFASAAALKGKNIEILAFEVANTIAKGYSLKQSLSKESMRYLKEEVLCSEGVQRLVSRDMRELLRIAAEDKRKELAVFANEVVRFGNRCRDPQWHHLDRYFDKLGKERSVQNQDRKEVEEEVQTLVAWAQQTGELYHEMSSLDRFEAEIRRKLQDEDLYSSYSRGENLSALRAELKSRAKSVKMLKKKSLWSKALEEVMEKLVDAVYFLHSEIEQAFGDAGRATHEKSLVTKKEDFQRLGSLGLALHYACIIAQIDGLVSRPGSVPVDTRDNLYQSLPPRIKGALRQRIPNSHLQQELTISHVKAELEKTLAWLAPIASNTSKAHHGFGWVGEWANTGASLDGGITGQVNSCLLQTLHHADRETTEEYIVELLVLLHYLVCLARDNIAKGLRSPPDSSPHESNASDPQQLDMAEQAMHPDLPCIVSTSREGDNGPHFEVTNGECRTTEKKMAAPPDQLQRLSSNGGGGDSSSRSLTRTGSHLSSRSIDDDSSPSIVLSVPVIDFELDRVKSLDIMDRVDDI